MTLFSRKKLISLDTFLMVLSIGLSFFIYYMPWAQLGRIDAKGHFHEASSRGVIFILSGIALFIFVLFNKMEDYPSLLSKGDNNPKTLARVLQGWRLVKLFCLLVMNVVLLVILIGSIGHPLSPP